ncbi:MAG: DUF2251 domain-containing protein [Planctomycetes bacterium]|nr:DUF2251 domain-containing protein [Planctomycetota bacterium]
MAVIVDRVEQGKPGDELLLGSQPEDGRAAVVFEDDGETGYFYACESVNGPILDALHIYNVASVTDRDRPSEYKIGWSPSGRQAVLMINGYPHAVFDFDRQKGWCRNGFPPSNEKWSLDGHDWDESCLAAFR